MVTYKGNDEKGRGQILDIAYNGVAGFVLGATIGLTWPIIYPLFPFIIVYLFNR
jgi:hypothetical protein